MCDDLISAMFFLHFRYNPLQFSSLSCSAIYSVSLHLNQCDAIKDSFFFLFIYLITFFKNPVAQFFKRNRGYTYFCLCVLRSVYRQILWALTFCKCQHQTRWIHLSYAAHNKQAALHKINVARG